MNQGEQIQAQARIEIRPPKLQTFGTILVLCAYGVLLMLPVLLSILLVSVMPLSFLTFLIPLLAIFVTTLALPIGFGNSYVSRLLRSIPPPEADGAKVYKVQLTAAPRLRKGLRALLDDADDIGWLAVTDSALVYHGDSVQLTLPFAQVRGVFRQSIGWRGLFMYGTRTIVETDQFPDIDSLEFADRGSRFLPESRRTAAELYENLRKAKP